MHIIYENKNVCKINFNKKNIRIIHLLRKLVFELTIWALKNPNRCLKYTHKL